MTNLQTLNRRIYWRRLLERAARDMGIPEGYAPSPMRYRKWARANGKPGDSTLMRRTESGRWTEVVRMAGLRPCGELWVPRHSTDPIATKKDRRAAMIHDLRRVAMLLGRPDHIPSPRNYRKLGRFAEKDVMHFICREAGVQHRWPNVAILVGLKPNRTRNGYWTREKAIEEYRRVAKTLGRKPKGPGLTAREIACHIAHPRTLEPYVGTVNEFAEAAGFQAWPTGMNRKAA